MGKGDPKGDNYELVKNLVDIGPVGLDKIIFDFLRVYSVYFFLIFSPAAGKSLCILETTSNNSCDILKYFFLCCNPSV